MDTNPSTYHHSAAVKEFNAKAIGSNLEGLGKHDLSMEGLIALARKETGLERFGDETFLPALKILLNSIDSEAQLNPF